MASPGSCTVSIIYCDITNHPKLSILKQQPKLLLSSAWVIWVVLLLWAKLSRTWLCEFMVSQLEVGWLEPPQSMSDDWMAVGWGIRGD